MRKLITIALVLGLAAPALAQWRRGHDYRHSPTGHTPHRHSVMLNGVLVSTTAYDHHHAPPAGLHLEVLGLPIIGLGTGRGSRHHHHHDHAVEVPCYCDHAH